MMTFILTITATIFSHIIASLYMQRPKYKKVITACIWSLFAILSLCTVFLVENRIAGFFCIFFLHAVAFYFATEGPVPEKIFLFLTYSNLYNLCLGTGRIISSVFNESILAVLISGLVLLLMHLFIYIFLRPVYAKSRMYFNDSWWKPNVALVFFLIQFLAKYTFNPQIDGTIPDFLLSAIIFLLSLSLIFDSVEDDAEANKTTYENITLRNLAYIDALTELKNKAAYIKSVRKHTILNRKSKIAQFVIVMLDINEFKQINDKQGHARGDEILKLVGTLLIKHTKDFVCECFRYGGDEFVLLVQNAQIPDINAVLVKLNQELMEKSQTSVSFGCARVNFSVAKPFDVAFEVADKIMYDQKFNKNN